MKTNTCFILLVLLSFLLIPGVVSRPSPNNLSHDHLISDGVDENRFSPNNPIRLIENDDGEGHLSKCEQMYGFLPCSETVAGHMFLIIVYEYLLFHAESYVDSGGKRVFKILGPSGGARTFRKGGRLTNT
ncbi:hypothetical protein CASFOL_017889 [Castilleja foliolosa]|uniref:Uncharacterized protein n=1 Tax=Castilleja foliolosa TaxID=1961234 RepID=A0ABD3D863_9LAMI